MALPQGIQRAGFLSPSVENDGVLHSLALKGGFQEMISLEERNSIPLLENSTAFPYNGFSASNDPWSSGRRRVGMLVNVLEENKFYQLIPVGYFGNGGNLGEADWLALSEYERAVRIDPTGSYTVQSPNPGNGFTTITADATTVGISADANACWVEVNLTGPQGIQGESAFKVLEFFASGNEYYKVGPDTDYVNQANNVNPTLTLSRGEFYKFKRGDAGHPLDIKDKDGNIIFAGIQSGSFPIVEPEELIWKIPQDATGPYTYVCSTHPAMTGTINICCVGDSGGTQPEPTATPVPPTATPVPPTATPVPEPTATPRPEPTPEPTSDAPRSLSPMVAVDPSATAIGSSANAQDSSIWYLNPDESFPGYRPNPILEGERWFLDLPIQVASLDESNIGDVFYLAPTWWNGTGFSITYGWNPEPTQPFEKFADYQPVMEVTYAGQGNTSDLHRFESTIINFSENAFWYGIPHNTTNAWSVYNAPLALPIGMGTETEGTKTSVRATGSLYKADAITTDYQNNNVEGHTIYGFTTDISRIAFTQEDLGKIYIIDDGTGNEVEVYYNGGYSLGWTEGLGFISVDANPYQIPLYAKVNIWNKGTNFVGTRV